MSASFFHAIEMAPKDPILGLTETYNADTHPQKVNLGVGVYTDECGKIPLLRCVAAAEAQRIALQPPRGYQAIEGPAAYGQAVQGLLFGADSPHPQSGRLLTVEALGGTGALKIGADFLKRFFPTAQVHISDPSWENHRALFEAAGFKVATYPYYDAHTRSANLEAMLAYLRSLPSGDIVVLHACCHNPTGADLSPADWAAVVDVVSQRGLLAFMDIAYQGFADGVREDAHAIDLFAHGGLPFLISSSFSKSFSLYGERVGALTIVTQDREESARVLSQVKRIIRTNYSNPPTHGGAIVAAILADQALRAQWEEELAHMRSRIRAMREALHSKLAAKGVDFSFITQQRGMFSYTGLSAPQVDRLRAQYGIHAVSTGRICVAALNNANIDYVAQSIVQVL